MSGYHRTTGELIDDSGWRVPAYGIGVPWFQLGKRKLDRADTLALTIKLCEGIEQHIGAYAMKRVKEALEGVRPAGE